MDIMYRVAEAVLIAFVVGGIFGAVIAVHIVSRREALKQKGEQI